MKKLTDAQFTSHFANASSVSKYTLEQGMQRAVLRNKLLKPMLAAKVDYATAAALADKMVIEALG